MCIRDRAYAVRGVAWVDLIAELEEADYRWLIPAAAAIVAGQFLRAQRWRRLFAAQRRPPFGLTFGIICVGYLVSTVFPLRLGDPFRAWAIDRYGGTGLVEAVTTVVAERVLDVLAILLLMAILLPAHEASLLEARFGPGPWADPRTIRWLTLGLLLAVYGALIAAASLGASFGEAIRFGLARLNMPEDVARRLGALAAGFAMGLRPLRRPRRAVMAILWSLTVWIAGALGYWWAMFAFELGLSFPEAVFVMCAIAFAAILPSTPGYTGVFHAAAVVGLDMIAGTPKDLAFSYAMVIHGLTIAVLLALGPVGLRILGMSRRELSQGVERSQRKEGVGSG
jgi:uncharacterized protein (TIRG00374 family)